MGRSSPIEKKSEAMDLLSGAAASIFGESMPPQPPPFWRCRCGSVKVEFSTAPRFCFDCHCQSCVACAEFCMTNIPSGTSALSECGGVKKALFHCGDCTLPPDAHEKLYWIRVTTEGRNYRSATKCCNTLMCTASLPIALRPFNRNGLYNFDGSRYEPAELLRGNCAHAAEPASAPASADRVFRGGIRLRRSIPEPRADGMPEGMLSCLLHAAAFAPGDGNPAWLPPSPAAFDVTLPKLWDDPE